MSVKKLKVDKNFVPCPVKTDDEMFQNGIFVFNITKMLEFIHGHPDKFKPESVAVNDFCSEFSSIDEAHMKAVQISEPVILAEISPGRYNLIDGNHRMEKARRLGIENILAYRLTVDQHIQFLTSQKAYVAYVEYWNSKMG